MKYLPSSSRFAFSMLTWIGTRALTLDALRNLGLDVFAFILSFAIPGIYWVAHDNMLHLIKAVDRHLVWLSLVLLLTVVFVAFPASLLGQHLGNPIAVILYAGSHPDVMSESLSAATVRSVGRLYSPPILVTPSGLLSRPGILSATLRYSLQSRRFSSCPLGFLNDVWRCCGPPSAKGARPSS